VKRLPTFLVALLVASVALSACDVARAGTRCKAGAAPARDRTHVLLCQGGTWKRTVTIGQAADIVLGTMPGTIVANVPSVTARAGQRLGLAVGFTVTSRTGKVLSGAKVELSAPATGAGLVPSSLATGVSGADGMVWFPDAVLADPVGSFTLRATVVGTDVTVGIGVVVVAGDPAALSIVSGQGQTVAAGRTLAPLSARVTDARGNPAPGHAVLVYYAGGLTSSLTPKAVLITDANGVATTTAPISATTTTGAFPVYLELERADVRTRFDHTVVAGPAAQIADVSATSPLVATANSGFANPVAVRVADVYGNPIAGAPVSFVVVPSGGADGLLGSSSAVTDADGRASVTATAGAVMGDYVVEARSGAATGYVSMRNT